MQFCTLLVPSAARSVVAGCWSLVAGRWSLVANRLLLAARWSLIADSMLYLARVFILLALAINVKRGLGVPLPPESDHEWLALIASMILGLLEATAFIALGSRARGATLFVYLLGGLGVAAVVTHVPMLIHMIRDQEPFGFFAMALVEGAALGLAALLKWANDLRAPPRAA